jgi:hypothetical protein
MTEPWKALLVIGVVALAFVVLVEAPRRSWTMGSMSDVNEEMKGSASIFSSVGGAGWLCYLFYGRATVPFVRIEVYSWGLRICPSHRLIAWYVPTTIVEWNRLSSIRASSTSLVIRVSGKRASLMRLSARDGSLPELVEMLGIQLDELRRAKGRKRYENFSSQRPPGEATS